MGWIWLIIPGFISKITNQIVSFTHRRNTGATTYCAPGKVWDPWGNVWTLSTFAASFLFTYPQNILWFSHLKPLIKHTIFFYRPLSMSRPFKNSPSPFLYPVGFSRVSLKGMSPKPSMTLHLSCLPLGLVVNAIKQFQVVCPQGRCLPCIASWCWAHAHTPYGTQVCQVQPTAAASPVQISRQMGVLGGSASWGNSTLARIHGKPPHCDCFA